MSDRPITTQPSHGETAEPFTGTERFKIVRQLGKGGMGEVFEVEDRVHGGRLALKVLRGVDPVRLQMFKQEFRSLADIVHPGLVRMHELHQEGKHWFLTMNVVEGADFFSYVRGDGGVVAESTGTAKTVAVTQISPDDDGGEQAETLVLDEEVPDLPALSEEGYRRLRTVLPGLCKSLIALHGFGKIHRDLKPSNVMVSPDGSVKLLDFGLASDFRHKRSASQRTIVTGTVPYMSPEQAAGEALTPASDWYSLGVMLYEVLVGHVPHRGLVSKVMSAKVKDDVYLPVEYLDLVPEDLARLCHGLLVRRPPLRFGPGEMREALPQLADDGHPVGETTALRLVGREKEMDLLETAYKDVCEGLAPRVVHLAGRSGMGKSALLQAFVESAVRQGACVHSGRCYERESVPYKALDPIVDSLAGHLATLSPIEQARISPRYLPSLLTVFPVLRQVGAFASDGGGGAAPVDTVELRRRAFISARELLSRIGERSLLVVVIDDLQWGDEDSARLLPKLVADPDAPRLMLILSYRAESVGESEHLDSVRTALAPGGEVFSLEVDRLSPDAALEMALHHLPAELEGRDELARHAAMESEGVPFFVEELCRHLASAPEGGEGAAGRGLPSLTDCTRLRLGLESEAARGMLEVVAVAARPLPMTMAAELAGIGTNPWDAVGRLRSGCLIRTSSQPGEVVLECYHDRIREAVAGLVEEDDAAGINLALARAFEGIEGTPPDVLADHYQRGGEEGKAAQYARLAGQQAAEAMAFGLAASRLRQSLEWADWSDEERRNIHVALGEALGADGRGLEACEEFLKATESAPSDEAWKLKRAAAEQALWSGYVDRGKELYEEILGQTGLRLPTTTIASFWAHFWYRFKVKLHGLDKAGTPPENAAELRERADAMWAISSGLAMVEPLRVSSFQSRALLYSLKSGDEYRAVRGIAVEAGYAAAFGGAGIRRAGEILKSIEERAAACETPHALVAHRLCRAIARFQEGRWRECVDDARVRSILPSSRCGPRPRRSDRALGGWRARAR